MPTPSLSVRSRERLDRLAIAAIAVGAVAVTVPHAPAMTASSSADAIWTGLAAVVAVIAGSQSRRSSWVVASVIVVAASGSSASLVPAAAALAIAVASVAVDRREPIAGAAIGALVVAAGVHLPQGPVRGATSVAVVVAVGWLVVSAVRLARPGTRRAVKVLAAAAGALLLVATLALLSAAGSAMRSVDAASAELRASVRAGADDDRALADHLGAAEDELAQASAAMTGPSTQIADVLPVLGRQSAALREVAVIGAELGIASGAVAEVADYRRLDLVDQRVDVDAVRSIEAPLREVLAGLEEAEAALQEVDRRWLVQPIDHRIASFHREVRDAIPSTELALDVIALAPGLLGAEGPRTYLLVFTQPSEARGLGGFVANWAELRSEDGRLELADRGRAEDLNLAPGFESRVLRGPADYVERYGALRIERFLQDVTFSPHMPSVSEVLVDQYEQVTGRPIDGVVVVDPIAMAAMLEVTGPVNVPELDEPLDADNAADFLLAGQYLEVDDRAERIDALSEASRRVFERLLRRRLLEPARMGRILGPSVDEGRLLAWSRHAGEQAVIERLGMDGAFEVPEGGELLSVVTQNSGNNKIDHHLRRTVAYDLAWDPATGEATGTVTVTLRNGAPSTGLPASVIGVRPSLGLPSGTNAQQLTISTGGIGEELRVDGVVVPVRTGVERGARAYSTDVAVAPGGEVEVVLAVRLAVAPGGALVLRHDGQPLPFPDEVTVTVAVPEGWDLDGAAWSPPGAGDHERVFRAVRREAWRAP